MLQDGQSQIYERLPQTLLKQPKLAGDCAIEGLPILRTRTSRCAMFKFETIKFDKEIHYQLVCSKLSEPA